MESTHTTKWINPSLSKEVDVHASTFYYVTLVGKTIVNIVRQVFSSPSVFSYS